jgi:hypothetical protein
MTELETRLRRELHELADHLVGPADEPFPVARRTRPSRRPLAIAVTVALVVVAAGGWLASRAGGPADTEVDVSPADLGPAAAGPGTWAALPDAPIPPRFYAATEWIGDEIVVWAGASRDRAAAFGDAAAYDPATDSWRVLPVPGWGHPGLVSADWRGRLVALAKGGVVTLDFTTGTSAELPEPPAWIALRDIAVADGVLYGFGPTDVGGSLGAIRYEPADEVWVPGPAMGNRFDTRQDDAPGLGAVSDGERVLLWSADNESALFDPAEGELRLLPRLGGEGSELATAGPVVTDAGFTVIATVDGTDVAAVLDGDEWTTSPIDLPDVDLSSATVFGAGAWAMVLPTDGFPVSVHVSSGTVIVHDRGPLAAMVDPNGTWTGEELILWGGASTGLPGVPNPPEGARWAPPGRRDVEDNAAARPSADAVMIRVIEPVSRDADGEPEACGPQPCFGIPIEEIGGETPEFDLAVIEGWYDGITLRPTMTIREYAGVLGVLGDRPALPSLCPDIRGPGQTAQMEMRPALRAYTNTVPDEFAASWNDQSTGAQVLWFVGDDFSPHQAAVSEIAGDVEVCVAGGARWSAAEMEEVRNDVRAELNGEQVSYRTYQQRVIVDVPVLDPAIRRYLESRHPSIVISPPRIEALDVPADGVPPQRPVMVGDVDLPTSGRGPRFPDSATALGSFTLSFDEELRCFYSTGDNVPGERTVILWPEGYSAASDPATVFDIDGRPSARVGETFELGGGWIPIARTTISDSQRCGATTAFIT